MKPNSNNSVDLNVPDMGTCGEKQCSLYTLGKNVVHMVNKTGLKMEWHLITKLASLQGPDQMQYKHTYFLR